MNTIAAFVGRILLSLIFIVAGISKLFDPAGTQGMLSSVGLSPNLALPAAIFELVAGLAIALGFMTRLFAILLAGFCLVTILFFHREFTDPVQSAMAMKNLAIAGGLLCLFAHSQMRWSYDSMRVARKGEIAERDALARAHEAELRAARAEGKAEALPTTATVAPVAPAASVATTRRVDRDRDGVDDRVEGTPVDPRMRP